MSAEHEAELSAIISSDIDRLEQLLAENKALKRKAELFDDLLKSLRRVTDGLMSHVTDEANRAGENVRTYCPCFDNEIKEARNLIEKAEKV